MILSKIFLKKIKVPTSKVLIKISKRVIKTIINYYESLDRKKTYDGQNFDNMYMTSFIQMIIENLLDVQPVFIDGGWLEIDSLKDIEVYDKIGIQI